MVHRAKTMKTLPEHRATDVNSLSDLGLFNLPRAAGRTLMSMAASDLFLIWQICSAMSANDLINFWDQTISVIADL